MDSDEARELELLVERLRRRYPTIPGAMIRREVERLSQEYDGAQVRTFLTILVRREARQALARRRKPT
ncbi:MAG TPA: hypothetical protein VHO29_01020 [Marmoricola sp.]|nr:hypothetical protein [Marmoricola sp.]